MSAATDALRAAFRKFLVENVPGSGANEPDKDEIRSGLATLGSELSSIGAGQLRYATKALLDADTGQADGTLARVYRNNGDPADPLNGVYQWDAAADEWVVAEWYYEAVAAVVQPLVDQAEAAATELSEHAADLALGHDMAVPARFTIGRSETPVTGSTYSTFTTAFRAPVLRDSTIRKIRLFAGAGATTIAVKRFDSATLNQIGSDVVIPISAGLNVLTADGSAPDFDPIPVLEGELIGWYVAGGTTVTLAGAPNDVYLFSASSGNQTSLSSTLVNSARLQIGFDLQPISPALQRRDIDSVVDAVGSIETQTIGRTTVVTGSAAGDTSVAMDVGATADGFIKRVRFFLLSGGTFTFAPYRYESGNLIQTAPGVTLTGASGANLFDADQGQFDAVPINAGDLIMFYAGTRISYTSDPGEVIWYKAGDVAGSQFVAAVTGQPGIVSYQAGFDIEYFESQTARFVGPMSQAAYDALPVKTAGTIYMVT